MRCPISCIPAVVGIAFQQSLPFQATSNAVRDGVRQVGQLRTCRCLHPAKSHARSIRAIEVDTVQKEHVEMDVRIILQRTPTTPRPCLWLLP